MKSREQEEKDNWEILLRAAGGDPQALANVVKQMLLADKTIKAPPKQIDAKEEAMMEAARDILKK